MAPLTTTDESGFYKTAVSTILDTYSQLKYTPQGLTWTILASFFLSRQSNIDAGTTGEVKVISIATGTKCLPASKLSKCGEIIHDSHAEVLARRSALRWLFEEIQRVQTGKDFTSAWIEKSPDRKFKLQEGVELNLYVSTVPCGDASMRFLASSQDEEIAALKNASAIPTIDINHDEASRGRDNYARLGALRTKPGRADSPATLCMSCSDKIAKWTVLGVQGALGSLLLEPIYLTAVVVGEVPEDLQETVKEDCERAFWKRLGDLEGLRNQPKVLFTDLAFEHSRSGVECRSNSEPQTNSESKSDSVSKPDSVPQPDSEEAKPDSEAKPAAESKPNSVSKSNSVSKHSSCGESIFWLSDSEPKTYHVVINGLKRGVAPKHRLRDKSRPLICRLSMLQLFDLLNKAEPPQDHTNMTYLELKQSATTYQSARTKLLGPNGPFSGWVMSGMEWQAFKLPGQEQQRTTEEESPSVEDFMEA